MTSKPKKGLGRGLSALMADVTTEPVSGETETIRRPDQMMPIERIVPNPDQPRRTFTQAQMDELAASVREKGVIQPLIVRPRDGGLYEIVAGERRWRAAQMAQRHEVPVVIRDFTDTEVLEIAIIENIQRADLNPVEEAMGYRQLMDRFGHTQEKLAEALSKSRSHIANMLRLLQLPEDVLRLVRDGQITTGHARALITTDDPVALARQIIARGLSVRETEKLAKSGGTETKPKAPRVSEKDADTRALEADLSANLGLKVAIDHSSDGENGRLTIAYKTLDELDAICRLLSASPLDVSR